jgi:1-acyl-sn-glycerol-3-phosphate acyltransferase
MKALTRVRYFGVPDIRDVRSGLLIAANHQSFLDPVLVGMPLAEPISYVARRSLFRIRGLSLLMRALGAHPIRRGAVDSEGVRTVLRLLRNGEAVLLFPEGTRTRDGSLGRFKPGVAAMAIRCGVPVLPVCIEGAFECWPRTRAFPRPGRVAVAFGRLVGPRERDAGRLIGAVREEVDNLQVFLKGRLNLT